MDSVCPGVIFDQHYTDSLVQHVLADNKPEMIANTRPPIQIEDILISLLLHGNAHLLEPIWYKNRDTIELDRLRREGLVNWIPQEHTISAMQLLAEYLNKLDHYYQTRYTPDIPYDTTYDGVLKEDIDAVHIADLDRRIFNSDAENDKDRLLSRLLYLMPTLKSHMQHYLLEDTETPSMYISEYPTLIISNFFSTLHRFPGDDVVAYAKTLLEEFLEFTSELHLHPTEVLKSKRYDGPVDSAMIERCYGDRTEIVPSVLYKISRMLLATISSNTIDSFASETGYVVKTAAAPFPPVKHKMISSEEYILVQAQFKKLRYPVIQNIDDVLRLRDDKRLGAYRTVIAEYSDRLREELEQGKCDVLEDFKKDMELSLRELNGMSKWSRIENPPVYISIPLSVLETVMKLTPMSIVISVVSTISKAVSTRKRKKLDWMLFGRS